MFCLSGKGSVISCSIFPPYDVSDGEYEIALVDLATYNTIPNIEKDKNDKFYYKFNNNEKVITINEGTYEIDDIYVYLKGKFDSGVQFSLFPNNNTLKAEIETNVEIDFTKPHNIGSLLGFKSQVLKPGKHSSDRPEGVEIIQVNTIRVECSIARGSYQNGAESHVLHEFFPQVGVGYKIVEAPTTLLYLPLNVRSIHNITVSLKDQNDKLVNLRKEIVSIRLHVKKRNGSCI